MILINGVSPEQINMMPLSTLERSILSKKQNSPVVYRYDSLGALNFELKTRVSIVEAAKTLNASGVDFADFDKSRCNEQFWIRMENGGFQLRSDVLPSDGINDIFRNGKLYAFECSMAIVMVLYKAILDVLPKQTFNRHFQDLVLYGWHYDKDLPLRKIESGLEVYPGDVQYFKNPDYDPETPEWQGENVVVLGDDLYFGHGIGIRTSRGMIDALNKARRPFSYTSAYLMDEVVILEYELLRTLPLREERTGMDDVGVLTAHIGTQAYHYKNDKFDVV
ncbi:protein-glutamine gamma-glutamyltransferase [Paenibacillus sp. SC116]|uniref:protein-glutamine gamma-glutamyltransferase n=1 Tax=Paenibacillus sp. SC116 TaxID=2968986 RepID=UPI00215B6E6E|nr:protein-glutamine gamma-glutamyltransferase [Paenibacillus sp. SC116]MCR8844978.1 protein-glutamine gamma-glutamyltransferase [Paenibacillus sp. SC116]